MRKLINNIIFRKQKSRQVGRSHAPQQHASSRQPTMTPLPASSPPQAVTPAYTPYVYLHK